MNWSPAPCFTRHVCLAAISVAGLVVVGLRPELPAGTVAGILTVVSAAIGGLMRDLLRSPMHPPARHAGRPKSSADPHGVDGPPKDGGLPGQAQSGPAYPPPRT